MSSLHRAAPRGRLRQPSALSTLPNRHNLSRPSPARRSHLRLRGRGRNPSSAGIWLGAMRRSSRSFPMMLAEKGGAYRRQHSTAEVGLCRAAVTTGYSKPAMALRAASWPCRDSLPRNPGTSLRNAAFVDLERRRRSRSRTLRKSARMPRISPHAAASGAARSLPWSGTSRRSRGARRGASLRRDSHRAEYNNAPFRGTSDARPRSS